jgi:hypothetical protein
MIKQDPESETFYIIWYARELYHYEETSDRLRDDGRKQHVANLL